MALLFPRIPVCAYCGQELPAGEVCSKCEKLLERYALFGRAQYPFDCCGAYHYNQLASWLIQSFKFEDSRWLADYIARQIWRAVQGERFDALCFVPLHRKRLAQRGFNQARLLAEKLAQLSGLPCLDVLQRVRDTKTQSHLPHAERRENVRGAFILRPGSEKQLRGRRMLLVDDVITTGATISDCAELLKQAGAQVLCAAFAVAAPAVPEKSNAGKLFF